MLSAIIIDDEINGAESLQILVKECCSEVTILSVETDPLLAIEAIKKYKPNLLFLDIEMPGISGFEILTELEDPLPKIIFTTAYSQYAVQAFRHNAVDYLLKPIIVSDLISAVNKAKEKIQTSVDNKLKNKSSNGDLMNDHIETQKISIHSQSEIISISSDKIVRFEADSNYTHIHLVGGKKITSSKTLKEYEDQLTDKNFYRVHNAYIVNTRQVEKYVRGDNAYLIMKDNSKIEVSRRKKSDFLMNFYKGKGI
jgi:two-component system, LytTR family, response regulator